MIERDTINQAIEYHKCSYTDQIVVYVNTIEIFKKKLPDLNSYRLGDIYYNLFNKTIENQHRAEADVKAMYGILNDIRVKGSQSVCELIVEYAKTSNNWFFYQ